MIILFLQAFQLLIKLLVGSLARILELFEVGSLDAVHVREDLFEGLSPLVSDVVLMEC